MQHELLYTVLVARTTRHAHHCHLECCEVEEDETRLLQVNNTFQWKVLSTSTNSLIQELFETLLTSWWLAHASFLNGWRLRCWTLACFCNFILFKATSAQIWTFTKKTVFANQFLQRQNMLRHQQKWTQLLAFTSSSGDRDLGLLSVSNLWSIL